MTGKDKVKVTESTLGSTLGEESTGLFLSTALSTQNIKNHATHRGLVIFDYEGHPIRFNQITVFEDIVAKHKSVRFCFVACVLDMWVY